MMLGLLFVTVCAWCAQDAVVLEQTVTRSMVAENRKNLVGPSVPPLLTKSVVEYEADPNRDRFFLRNAQVSCGVMFGVSFASRKKTSCLQGWHLRCEKCSQEAHGSVLIQCKEEKGNLLIRAPQDPKKIMQDVAQCSLKSLREPSCWYVYCFQQDRFSVRQVVCESEDGAQFIIEASVNYKNLSSAKVSWGVEEDNVVHGYGERFFYLPRCLCKAP